MKKLDLRKTVVILLFIIAAFGLSFFSELINFEALKENRSDILNKTRRQETVVARQCFGLILTHKFNFTLSRVGDILNCNHATVIHGNKNVKQFIELKYNDYIDAMLNWKFIFDENQLYFNEGYSTSSAIENRIMSMITESIELKVLDKENASDMLRRLLETLNK